jgi:hypothetical protein
MCGSIPLLPQDAYMAWCSVKAQGQVYPLPLPYLSYYNLVTFGLGWVGLVRCGSVWCDLLWVSLVSFGLVFGF